jgi:hypothetical protein
VPQYPVCGEDGKVGDIFEFHSVRAAESASTCSFMSEAPVIAVLGNGEDRNGRISDSQLHESIQSRMFEWSIYHDRLHSVAILIFEGTFQDDLEGLKGVSLPSIARVEDDTHVELARVQVVSGASSMRQVDEADNGLFIGFGAPRIEGISICSLKKLLSSLNGLRSVGLDVIEGIRMNETYPICHRTAIVQGRTISFLSTRRPRPMLEG